MDELQSIIRNQVLLMKKLDLVLAYLTVAVQEEEILMQEVDDLAAQVTQNTDLELSGIQLIQGLAAQISASATDPTKIKELSAKLHDSAAALSAAIIANTPAAPTA